MTSPAPEPTGAQAPVLNIANALTVVRLLMVPVFVVLLFSNGGNDDTSRVWAAVVFVVASLTDLADGALARRHNLITPFGKIADPLADKALTGAALIGLSILGDLAWWITIVILAREIGVTLLRFAVIRHGVIAASRGGKAKTLLQMIAIVMYILPLTGWLDSVAQVVMGLAVIVTVATGADYIAKAAAVRRASIAS